MPQPADYLVAYMIIATVAILGCGVVGFLTAALIDHALENHKRAVLRRRRGQ